MQNQTNPKELQKKYSIGKYRPSQRLRRMTVLLTILAILLSITIIYTVYTTTPPKIEAGEEICTLHSVICGTETLPEIKTEEKRIKAYITGYNTIPEQTDLTPCVAEPSGENICGRSDTAACPREIPLGTKITIDGKEYECLDYTAKRYNDRFDINCDKDMECPYEVTGRKEVIIWK